MGNTFWTDGVPGVGTALNQTNMRQILMGDGLACTGDLALGGATGLTWDDTNKRLGLGTATPSQQLHLTGSLLLASSGNLLLGGASPGTSLAKGLVLANGTAPSGAHPADAVQCWAADQAAGQASLFLRTENGAQYTLGSNLGLFGTSFGTSADKVIALSSGTAPSGSHPTDAIQLWCADRGATAGKAGLHLRSEDGTSHVFADKVGINTLTPAATALLELSSTTLGFLPPRLTTTERDAISSPATGLVIFNTTTGKLNVRGASAWEAVTST